MVWEKLRNPATATFKNPNFQSLFTAENKKSNLHKIRLVKLSIINGIFLFLEF